MGFTMILFFGCLLLSVILHRYAKDHSSWDTSLAEFWSICSKVITVFIGLFIVVLLNLIFFSDRFAAMAVLEKNKLERMLVEDYNAENLTKALDFNMEQRKSAINNASWLTYCFTNCYILDTIVVPGTKFVPESKTSVSIEK